MEGGWVRGRGWGRGMGLGWERGWVRGRGWGRGRDWVRERGWVREGVAWVLRGIRGGCSHVIMHHRLAAPYPHPPCFNSKIGLNRFYVQLKVQFLRSCECLCVCCSCVEN